MNFQPLKKVRVSFKGGSYSFLDAKNAGLIQGRASFKGGSLSRIYGRLNGVIQMCSHMGSSNLTLSNHTKC